MRTSSGEGMGGNGPVCGGYFSMSKRSAFSASLRSVTAVACAAMDRPLISITCGMSWSIVIETRLSRAMFWSFWLLSPQRK
jgi:hypothetical protein